MKIAILGFISFLILFSSVVFSQTVRIVDGTNAMQEVEKADADVRMTGYYFDNHMKYVQKVNVQYSGTIQGKKVDVEYSIRCAEEDSVMATGPGFKEIRSCPKKTILSGKIVYQEGQRSNEIALQDMIVSSSNNILSSWRNSGEGEGLSR